MSIKYSVKIEHYAERHFIKSFAKKYSRAWDITLETLIRELQSFEVLLLRAMAEFIAGSGNIKICKVEFTVAGSNQSRHGSGNRCIVALHEDTNAICVLLVYNKTDLSDGNETAQWKQIIKDNYPEYRALL